MKNTSGTSHQATSQAVSQTTSQATAPAASQPASLTTSSTSSQETSYLNATGPIPYGMTNDYMFRTVLQKNNYVLKGLICSLLHLKDSDVSSVTIINPIEPGDSVDDKEFILDINVLMNSNTVINLEMQMTYQLDWQERSLSYLCRSFDQLSHGMDYSEVMSTIHIGFLNFTPDRTIPEFYSSYRLLNEKTYRPYSDKFCLRVVNLKQIDLATDEDRASHIDYWARLFVATSWEDIQMISKNNPVLSAASQTMYESNADLITRQKCRAREDYCKLEKALAKRETMIAEMESVLAEAKSALAKKDASLAEKDASLVEAKSALAEKDALIQTLQKELSKTQK